MYINTHTYIYIHTHIHTYIHTYIHTHISMGKPYSGDVITLLLTVTASLNEDQG